MNIGTSLVLLACAPEDFADVSVDCIVRGDGTSIIAEIVEAIQTGRQLDEIPGLALPLENDGLQFTQERPYMPNPDSLPFPRRDLVAHLRHRYFCIFHQPVAIMKTTWSCWYNCNFCFPWRVTNGIPYSRSPESIADELEQIEAEEVYIVDDIFLINPKVPIGTSTMNSIRFAAQCVESGILHGSPASPVLY